MERRKLKIDLYLCRGSATAKDANTTTKATAIRNHENTEERAACTIDLLSQYKII